MGAPFISVPAPGLALGAGPRAAPSLGRVSPRAMAGHGIARQRRIFMTEQGGIWRSDAVYTVSESLPCGPMATEAELVAVRCAENANTDGMRTRTTWLNS